MIRSITLQNFKSFGAPQTVPLEPITVLVGPNNSGKSSFMSVGRFLGHLEHMSGERAVEAAGGYDFLIHRPHHGEGVLALSWEDESKRYDLPSLSYLDRGRLPSALTGTSLSSSRLVKLSLEALRSDSEVVPEPRLGVEGSGMPSVLGLWQGATPEKREQLEDFLRRCLPEVRHVLVRPAPKPGHQRLWIRQADGEDFDAEHLSDGLLCFIALAMHAIDAGPGQLLFIEEPEQYIHPRRLHELVDLLRELVQDRGNQFVLATHSPVLLNAFRDEPEAILLFRRSETGTRVRRLADIPPLKQELQKLQPGDMLALGFFNEAFKDE